MSIVHISGNEGLSAVYPSQVLRPMSLVGRSTGAPPPPVSKAEPGWRREGDPVVVHLTAREGLSAVYLPQVARPMSLLRASGLDVHLVALPPIGELARPHLRARWHRRRTEIGKHFGLDITLLPSPPARWRGFWNQAIALRLWLRRRYRDAGDIVLHCRGTEATLTALRACRDMPQVKVLSDVRGIGAPEALMHAGYADAEAAPAALRALYAERDEQQRQAVVSADAVLCVSNAMRRELGTRWGLDTERMTIVPCCTNVEAGARAAANREAARRKLGLQDRFVLSYCGSCQPWQMLSETLALFQAIAALRPDAHFLGLSTDEAGVRAAINRCGISAERHTVLSVPHTQVPNLLAAADVGLLLRSPSVVNQVASPVKFAEYLACGVPVIVTSCIGDYSREVLKHNIGAVFDSLGGVQSLLKHTVFSQCADMRHRCVQYARDELDWRAHIPSILSRYRSVLREC